MPVLVMYGRGTAPWLISGSRALADLLPTATLQPPASWTLAGYGYFWSEALPLMCVMSASCPGCLIRRTAPIGPTGPRVGRRTQPRRCDSDVVPATSSSHQRGYRHRPHGTELYYAHHRHHGYRPLPHSALTPEEPSGPGHR